MLLLAGDVTYFSDVSSPYTVCSARVIFESDLMQDFLQLNRSSGQQSGGGATGGGGERVREGLNGVLCETDFFYFCL